MDRTIKIIKEIIKKKTSSNAEIIWKCAHRYLWNKHPFSEREISQTKNFIKEYFEEIMPELFFIHEKEKVAEFATRILLANDFVKRKSGRFIPHPVIWFNPNNPYGFVGTKDWYTKHMENIQYQNIRFYYHNGEMMVIKDNNGFRK